MTSEYSLEHSALDNISSISFEEARALGEEYGALMTKKTLSDAEDVRIDEILHLATIDDNVDFWVSHAACEYGAKLGLLDPDAIKSYEDQRAILRERIDTFEFSDATDEAVLHRRVRRAQLKDDPAQATQNDAAEGDSDQQVPVAQAAPQSDEKTAQSEEN